MISLGYASTLPGLSIKWTESRLLTDSNSKCARVIYESKAVKNAYEPAHDKTYNNACVTSKDSDKPVHPSSMARVLVYPSLNSPENAKVTCDQRIL